MRSSRGVRRAKNLTKARPHVLVVVSGVGLSGSQKLALVAPHVRRRKLDAWGSFHPRYALEENMLLFRVVLHDVLGGEGGRGEGGEEVEKESLSICPLPSLLVECLRECVVGRRREGVSQTQKKLRKLKRTNKGKNNGKQWKHWKTKTKQ